MVIVLTSVAFYFWASSANHSPADYSQLIESDYPAVADEDSVYSIITYNIGYLSGMTNNLAIPRTKGFFDENLAKVYGEFEKINADIICFQEIDFHSQRSYFVNQQEELQKIGFKYIFQAVNWDVNYLPFPYYPPSAHFGEVYSGQSIFSKYQLTDTERIVLERVADSPFYRDAFYLDRLAQIAKTTIDGKTVVLINVHFEAFDTPTRIKHAQQIVQLYNLYKDEYPVLMVGDFNSDADYDNAAVKLIIEIPGIKSAGRNKGKTFPSTNPEVQIDYIFYNEKFIELKRAAVLTSFGDASDHLPVIMEFKLR